jgi:hypothetical protein
MASKFDIAFQISYVVHCTLNTDYIIYISYSNCPCAWFLVPNKFRPISKEYTEQEKVETTEEAGLYNVF